jgi:glycosyltransferase involved in cell wall biosynthesis
MNDKVTKVLHYVSIMDRGGEETFIMNVFRTIDRSKVMFDFICTLPEDGEYGEEIKELGGKVWHADFDRRKDHLRPLDNAIILKRFLKSHKGEFDVFHIHTQHAMDGVISSWAAKSAGVGKVIVHSHSANTVFHRTAHRICRPILGHMRILRFACSGAAGRWLFGNGRFDVVKSGIESERFLFNQSIRGKVRKENGWEGRFVIGHVGNFTYPKNHDFMIRIMKILSSSEPEALMVFIGKGDDMNKYLSLAEQLGIEDRIRFMGPREDVSELYQGMDFFIFPSLFEGLGMALIEAQISGLHCLASTEVPAETRLSEESVSFKSLSDGPESWAKAIVTGKSYPRKNMAQEAVEAGIDIKSIASLLTEYYRN